MNVKERVWKGFIAQDSVDLTILPEEVATSWLHCRALEVDPYARKSEAILTPPQLREQQRKNERLIALVQQELRMYEAYFKLQLPVFILTDANGYILWRDGHEGTKRVANDMSFSEGHRWHEQDVGTNAISLAIQTGAVMSLTGYDHYAVGSHAWACTAAAIYDEHDKVCAVLDISSHLNDSAAAQEVNTFMKLLTATISYKIKSRYLEERKQLVDYSYRMTQPGVVCDEFERIVKISAQLFIEEAQWQGQPIHALLKEQVLQALPQPIFLDDQMIGYFYPIVQQEEETKQFFYQGVPSKNEAYRAFMAQVEKVASSPLPVHIYGESGSGKEVIAKTLHENSAVANGPLIAINCGAISESLLESELFGYAPGAFTGANAKGYKGKIAEAHGGTLFLDEVDSMSKRMQAALLRVLENQEVTRIGSTKVEQVSFRIVTASNRDLRAEVEAENFRMDLFYRLYVCPLSIPPLRERKEDIFVFMQDYCMKKNWYPYWLATAYEVAQHYEWYGNIRELNNFLERLHVYYEHVEPTREQLQQTIEMGTIERTKRKRLQQNVAPMSEEEKQLRAVLEQHHYHISKAAAALGMARSTLYRKMKRYNLK